MNRRVILVLVALPCLASDCSDPPTGPSKYSDSLVSLIPDLGRLCDDPAGAPIAVDATYQVTCSDEDQCGRDHGEQYTVTHRIDASDSAELPQDEVTLDNGDVIAFDDSCMQFTGEVQGFDEAEASFRHVGGLLPGCVATINGPAASGATRFRLILDHPEGGRIETECDRDSAYSSPTPTTLEPRGTDFCDNGATLDLGGTASAVCGTAASCTAGDALTVDYDLLPFGDEGSWPVATVSDGGSVHFPFHCQDAVVQLVGMSGEAEVEVSAVIEGCVLAYDQAEADALTDLRLTGSILGLPDTEFSRACP